MKISTLFALIPLSIIASVHAMESEMANASLRSPMPIRTMIHETIEDHAEEIIKRDLISIPEYESSDTRGAYSIELLNLYKEHNPKSKHYQNAIKWAIANTILTYPNDI